MKERAVVNVLKHLLYILGISMVPVIELRGAIPVGLRLGMPFWTVFLTALIGNLLPVPILILFTRQVFEWLRKKSPLLERFVSRMERKAEAKRELVDRYKFLGLFILVAIPLPGTGAWTGSLVSAVFGIDLRHALPAIALGVLTAGIIVSVISYGVSIFL